MGATWLITEAWLLCFIDFLSQQNAIVSSYQKIESSLLLLQ